MTEQVLKAEPIPYTFYRNDTTGQVFAFPSDGSQAAFMPEGLREMTEEEVHAHRNPAERFWTDGVRLVSTAAHEMMGMWLATDPEIAALLPAMHLQLARDEIARLRRAADDAITPLQDAVDLDDATADEEALLRLWRKYRVALNRLPEQPGYPTDIEWPVPPADIA